MKKYLLSAALLSAALIPAAASAQDDLSVSVSVDFVSEYVFRGISLEAEAIQPGVEFGLGDFTFGAWGSAGFGTNSQADTDELDIYASYGFDLSDTISGSVGATLYSYPDANDTFEASAGLGFDTMLAPSITAYYDFTLEAFTLEGGIGHSFPIDAKTSFDLGASAGLVDADGGGSYEYGNASASLGYAYTDDVTTYLGANYTLSSEDTLGFTKNTPKDNLLWFGVGIAAGF